MAREEDYLRQILLISVKRGMHLSSSWFKDRNLRWAASASGGTMNPQQRANCKRPINLINLAAGLAVLGLQYIKTILLRLRRMAL